MVIQENIFFAITKIVNRVLAQDPTSLTTLQDLNGKCLMLKCKEPAYEIFANFSKDGVQITANQPKENIHITISGSSQNFLKLLFRQNQALQQSGLAIQGDASVAELLYSLFKKLNIDWEEEISKVTGDTIAHQLANFAKSSSSKSRNAIDTFTEMLNDYLIEESNLIISSSEIDNFNQSVDVLKQDFDRLQARINHLEQSLPKLRN